MTIGELRLPALGIARPVRLPAETGPILLGIPVAVVLGVAAALHPDWWRALLAAAVAINLIVISMRWPRAGAVATLLWLPFVALIRRLLIAKAGWTEDDPLLLVGPVVALFLCYRIFVIDKRAIASDRLSKLVLTLLGIAVLGAFNPFGVGGVVGGLAGLIYLGVPLLWFFIGRELGSRQAVTRLIYGVVVIAVGIACYGLYQTKFGSLPQWDRDWYNIAGFDGLKAGTVGSSGPVQLRPWGTFASAGEYAFYLGFAFTFALAMLYHRRPVLFVAMPVLALALFVAGGRSQMALTLLTCVVLTALRTRNRVVALVIVVLGIGATFGAAAALGPRLDRAANLSSSATEKRQVGGLLNPLDPKQSTFLGHYDQLVKAVDIGVSNPVGLGTGASNLGARVGGGAGIETDIDIGQALVSFGLAGGLVLLAIIVLAFKGVFGRYLRGPPDPLVFAAAGIMVVNLGQWLQGGHYAASPLMWFMLGFAARPGLDRPDAKEPPPRRFGLSRRRPRSARAKNQPAVTTFSGGSRTSEL